MSLSSLLFASGLGCFFIVRGVAWKGFQVPLFAEMGVSIKTHMMMRMGRQSRLSRLHVLPLLELGIFVCLAQIMALCAL